MPDVIKLVMVIADEPGDRLILQTLLDARYGVTALPSIGGFTRQVSKTFLCAVPEDEVDDLLALLRRLPAPALVLVLSAERFERVGEVAPVG
jgi:uncharacterized protein YaaQ